MTWLVSMTQIQLQAQTYRVVVDRYANGNVALYLLNLHDDRLVTSCTVDVPGYELLQGECLIKADAENAGILKALVDAGIIKRLGIGVPYTRSGTIAHLCQLISSSATMPQTSGARIGASVVSTSHS